MADMAYLPPAEFAELDALLCRLIEVTSREPAGPPPAECESLCPTDMREGSRKAAVMIRKKLHALACDGYPKTK